MIDEEARLRRIDYGDRIFFNSITGIAGVIYPIGTAAMPSSVIANVITLCAAYNLHDIDVHGILQLLAAMEHYCFLGHCHESVADVLDLNGQDVDDSRFDNCLITGAQGGANFATFIDCILYNMTGFRGMAERCALYTPLAVSVGVSDFDHCTSLHEVLTVTVGAPTRLSFKKFSGGMILTLQTGGAALVRGISGYLEVDEMTGGTLDIYADAAEIQINADCTVGTINIYGNARVTDNSGATVVNDYSKETQLDAIEAAQGKQLFTMDFWSDTQEELQVTSGATTETLPSVTIAEVPGTFVRAIAMFKFRMVENTYADVNAINGAQHIQVQKAGGAWQNAISIVDTLVTLADTAREGGDVFIGDHDIAGEVDANAVYNFQWLNADSLFDFIQFNDVQVGLRIWYSL